MKRGYGLVLVVTLALVAVACSQQQIDDAAITSSIKTKYAAEPNTSALKIIVETHQGVVTLAGTVPTQAEKAKAEEIARATGGVASVVNQIEVNPNTISTTNIEQKVDQAAKTVGEGINDTATLTRIKAKFVTEGILGTNVDVKEGVATLKGEVTNAVVREKAEALTRSTEGVRSVVNQLTVRK